MWTDRPLTSKKNIAASDVLYLITVYLSKCSTAGIYLRLTPRASHHLVLWATLALGTAWITISIFVILANCQLNGHWGVPVEQCFDLVSKPTQFPVQKQFEIAEANGNNSFHDGNSLPPWTSSPSFSYSRSQCLSCQAFECVSGENS